MKAHKNFVIIPYKNKLLKFDKLISGKIIYKNYSIDLITEKKISLSAKDWFEENSDTLETFYLYPKVIHYFYELGFLFEFGNLDFISEDTILAIELNFHQMKYISPEKKQKIHLQKIREPIFEDYESKFQQGQKNLIAGNCYQFNLTDEYLFRFRDGHTPEDFIFKIWEDKKNRGAYGSATYLSFLNKLFLSNSPECLFQIEGNKISSMPIKGTIAIEKNSNIDDVWEKLISDQKSESELFMIADLIRNDLARIDRPNAIVEKKKAKLLVPNLLHQYSLITAKLNFKTKINTIMLKMFPGGSITGAPKKRVMKILLELESRERNFYCGSTLILYKEMKSASINIRSSEIDFNQNNLRYQAGGGITLRSTSDNEFLEMSYKAKSYINLLTL